MNVELLKYVPVQDDAEKTHNGREARKDTVVLPEILLDLEPTYNCISSGIIVWKRDHG